MKLTPKDYIDARHDLAKAGFSAIKTLLSDNEDGAKSPSDIAVLYGIDVKYVELVATVSSYAEYKMVVDLELKRESLLQEVEEVRNQKPELKKWHYYVAGIILLAILGGFVWLIVWVVGLLS